MRCTLSASCAQQKQGGSHGRNTAAACELGSFPREKGRSAEFAIDEQGPGSIDGSRSIVGPSNIVEGLNNIVGPDSIKGKQNAIGGGVPKLTTAATTGIDSAGEAADRETTSQVMGAATCRESFTIDIATHEVHEYFNVQGTDCKYS